TAKIAQIVQRAEDFGKPEQLPFERRFGCARATGPLANGCQKDECEEYRPLACHVFAALELVVLMSVSSAICWAISSTEAASGNWRMSAIENQSTSAASSPAQ